MKPPALRRQGRRWQAFVVKQVKRSYCATTPIFTFNTTGCAGKFKP